MFVVCGEALWDLFGSGEGGQVRFEGRAGGSPFNVAVGLARLDQPVALFACLSTDRLGQRLAEVLHAEGVATELLVRRDRPTTLSLVDVDDAGGASYAFYGVGGADRMIALADLPVLGPAVWGLHAGSYSLVADPVGTSLLALFRREAGRRLLTLDPNVRLVAEPDRDLWRRRVDAFVAASDLVKVSVQDIAALHPGEPATAVARCWRAAGPAMVVTTDGARGATAYGAFGEVTMPAPAVTVADTVGAGDSFMAALVAGLRDRGIVRRQALAQMDREQVAALLGLAADAAAVTCGRRGADPPRRGEIGRRAGGPG